MRISDWSSDVCSSDLSGRHACARRDGADRCGMAWFSRGCSRGSAAVDVTGMLRHGRADGNRRPQISARRSRNDARWRGRSPDLQEAVLLRRRRQVAGLAPAEPAIAVARQAAVQRIAQPARHQRSEEHTSELQSLMRISYAVFCLKKKTHKTNIQQKIQ